MVNTEPMRKVILIFSLIKTLGRKRLESLSVFFVFLKKPFVNASILINLHSESMFFIVLELSEKNTLKVFYDSKSWKSAEIGIGKLLVIILGKVVFYS